MRSYQYVDVSKVTNADNWPELEERPVGSRVKVTIESPDKNRLYIFKQPKPQREAQIWSELIASFIAGDLLGWPVQHTSIAMRNGKIGNLLRYIYNEHADHLISGEDLCQHVDPQFDPKIGQRHNWELITEIGEHMEVQRPNGNISVLRTFDYFDFWVRAIVLDTLISNTDRHAQNWALLLSPSRLQAGKIMAPLFDNASSMGCEVDTISLSQKWFDKNGSLIESKVDSYAAKGQHHLRDNKRRFRFQELAKLALDKFPELKGYYEQVAELDLNQVERLIGDIQQLKDIPDAAKLSPQRAQQILALLHCGQKRIISSLEDIS